MRKQCATVVCHSQMLVEVKSEFFCHPQPCLTFNHFQKTILTLKKQRWIEKSYLMHIRTLHQKLTLIITESGSQDFKLISGGTPKLRRGGE